MRNLVLPLVAVVLLVGVVPRTAHAQKEKEQAAQHFDVADKAYRSGDYDKAVKEFVTAYQLAPINALLFNIGQAYRMQGDKEKALGYYEKYVEFEPAGAQVVEAKKHIDELKVDVETARREREARDSAEAAQRAEKEAAEKAAADKLRAEEEARKRDEVDSAGSGLRIGGLVLGGAGLAAIGVGVAVAAGGTTGAGLGIAGGGVAALGAGTAMYFIGRGQQNDARERLGVTSMIVPTAAPGMLGVAWLGSF
jgi:tetratricopeptide (TPR) repeat protein